MAGATRKSIVKALDFLLDGSESNSETIPGLELQSLRDRSRRWTNSEHIIGYGLSPYREGGSGQVDCVTLYTSSPDSAELLTRRIPSRIQLPRMKFEMPVQAVNIGNIRPFSQVAKVRPVQAGYSVSHEAGRSGTIGLIVRNQNEKDVKYILSCGHVLTKYGVLAKGDKIVQPGIDDAGQAPKDVVGSLEDVVPITFSNREYLNFIDAAIARLDVDSRTEIAQIGAVSGWSKTVRRDTVISISGRTSGLSTGKILDPSARIRVPFERGPNTTSIAGFRDVVVCTPLSRGGDSGAAVLNPKKEVIGLVLAGSEAATIFCKVHYAFDRFKIQLP